MISRYVERYYTTTAPVLFPSGRFQTIEALAEAALRHFSMAQLSSNAEVLGSGARVRPIEAVYQDEFYRALHKVLRFSTRISSEWTEGSSGRIDFWLPDVKWGIEILRDGDQLGEHCQRFVGNGIYTGWIDSGWLVDWLIIDCRTSKPRKCGMLQFDLLYDVYILKDTLIRDRYSNYQALASCLFRGLFVCRSTRRLQSADISSVFVDVIEHVTSRLGICCCRYLCKCTGSDFLDHGRA